MLYHFECPECEFSDGEAGWLAKENEIYCALCAADNGVAVKLKRWPAEEGEVDAHPIPQD